MSEYSDDPIFHKGDTMNIQEEKQKFKEWLYEAYDTTYLSRYFFNTVESVYIGAYKNLKKPIPFEDLRDLWQSEMPDLRKIHDKNTRQGKEMNATQTALYDLAVVVSRYDDFLVEKERNRRIQAERENYKSQTHIDYAKLPKPIPPPQIKDLSKIIDE